MLDKAKNVWYSTSCSAGVAHLVERHLAKVEVASSSLVARSKKEVTTYVVTSFLDSGRELKCSGEVNSPSAKVLLRKTLVRRKSAGFLAPAGRGSNRARAKRENAPVGRLSPAVRVAARQCCERASSPAPQKEVTTYVVTSFWDSGRKLKCSGEVNSPSTKVLLRKTLVRRKSVVFCFGRPNRYGTSELGVLFL